MGCERNQENLKGRGWASTAMLKDTEYCEEWEEKDNG
jgi:hypothetical protein